LRNVNLKVSRTTDYENLKNISNISSEMKNKNNFIDELNTWKVQNNFKPYSNLSLKKKPMTPKSQTFKNLNDLNIMKTLSKENGSTHRNNGIGSTQRNNSIHSTQRNNVNFDEFKT